MNVHFPAACIDVRNRKRYDVGETFITEDKCCTCLVGGIHCASTVKTCQLGNKILLLTSPLLITKNLI